MGVYFGYTAIYDVTRERQRLVGVDDIVILYVPERTQRHPLTTSINMETTESNVWLLSRG